MINRNEQFIAPQGSTRILPGDVLYVLVKSSNVDMVITEILGKFTYSEDHQNSQHQLA